MDRIISIRVIKMEKNQRIRELLEELSKRKENIWKDLAKRLSKARRNQAKVNICSINRHANEKDNIIVPGKVLGYGTLNKKVSVSALSFSKQAREKIKNSGGECIQLEEIIEKNPKRMRIMG